MKLLPYDIEEGKNGRAVIKLQTNNFERRLLPQEVSAKVLDKMRSCAQRRTGRRVVNAVVTVPAYFNDQAKKATMEACAIAGINCHKIITEPTAAAIAYGMNKPSSTEKFCVVYDFGGGTLDVTVLRMKNREFHVKACKGNQNLGGVDIDNALMQHCIQKIKDEYDADISDNVKAMTRLRTKCQLTKHQL